MKFRTLADFSYDWVYWQLPDGSLVYVSPSCERITGYKAEEFIKDPTLIRKILGSENAGDVFSHFEKPNSETEYSSEFQIMNKNGETRWISHSCQPVLDEDGAWLGRRATNRDITDHVERAHAKDASLVSEEKFKLLVEKSFAGVFIIQDAKMVYVNPSFAKTFGYSPEEIIDKFSPRGLIHPSDIQAVMRKLGEILDGKIETGNTVCRAIRKDGSLIYIEVYGMAFEFQDKPAVMGMLLNVTERIKMEKSLIESQKKSQNLIETTGALSLVHSERKYRELADALPEIVFETDINGKIVYANERAFEITGYSMEDFAKGLYVHDFVSQEDKERAKKNFMRTLANDRYHDNEYTFVRKDGSTFPVIARSSLIVENDRPVGIRGLVVDISQRKKAEETLALSEKKYRELADSLPEIVFEADDRGSPTLVNKQTFKILDYSADEIMQMNIIQFLVPEDRQRAIDNIQRRMRGEESRGNQYTIARKDGSTFPAIIFTERLIQEDGKFGLRGIMVNISEAKKAAKDLEILNEKLRVVGSLTRHDVRNKLMAARTNVYLLKKRVGDNPRLVKQFDDIESTFASIDMMFEFSRLYEKIGVELPSVIDVEKCFDEAAALLPSSGSMRIVNECRGLRVVADSLLRQIFYNLLDNSLSHGEKVTQVQLRYANEAEGLKLFYEDDGVGIPIDSKPKLFSEGFSTGESTGLGLFLVKKMIEVYGWTITETGEPGKGAKFVITIPELSKNTKENYKVA